jgi:hypothetical protein
MIACDGRQGCLNITLEAVKLACDMNAIKHRPTFEVSGGANFSVLNSVITGCSSLSSGGFVRASDGALVSIQNSTIYASQSSEGGGAIALYGSILQIFSSLFSHCRSTGGGGAIWANTFSAPPMPAIPSSISITDSIFSHCASSRDGGAIFASMGTLILEFCTFDNNVAEGKSGGGGMCLNDVDATITFEVEQKIGQAAQNNTAPAGGGGLILWTGSTPKFSVQCAPGYEGSWSKCVPCSIGHYKNASGTHSCLACPLGSYSTAPASWSCTQCDIATFSTNLGANSSSTCTPCARDSSTLDVGSPSPGHCICDAGFEVLPDGTCVMCDAGKFKESKGTQSCTACPAGAYAKVSGATFCTPCPAGSTTLPGATDKSECFCSPGSSGPSEGPCTSCKAGSYGFGGVEPCRLCVPGTFSIADLTATCAQCEAGKYQALSGQKSCNACPTGKTTVEGVRELIWNGTLILTGSDKFQDCVCGPGYILNVSLHGTCTACTAGKYQERVSPEPGAPCFECAPGKYSAVAAPSCAFCQVGKYNSVAQQSSCTNCNTQAKQSCTKDSDCNYNRVSCPHPQQCTSNSLTYDSCFGYMCAPEGLNAQDVHGSSVVPGTCYAIYEGAMPVLSVSPCPSEQTIRSPVGSTSSESCEGYCAAGTEYDASSKTCAECRAGTYKEAGLGKCLSCAAGIPGSFTTGTGSQNRAACKCNQGYFGNTANLTKLQFNQTLTRKGSVIGSVFGCASCPVGKYKDFVGANSSLGNADYSQYAVDCQECEAGKAAVTRCFDGSCKNSSMSLWPFCPVAAAAAAAAAKSRCAAFSTNNPDDAVVALRECTEINTQQDCFRQDNITFNALVKDRCCKCGGGLRGYTPVAQTTCSACLPGKYTETTCNAACTDMTPMCLTPSAEDGCRKCAAGKYSDRSGARSNKCCKSGRAAEIDQCTPCEAGKYQNKTEQASCIACPNPYQTSRAERDKERDCYVECPQGKYAIDSTKCQQCPQNMDTAPGSLSTFMPGRNMVDDCECAPGFYNESKSQACTACDVGFYKNTTSNDGCRPCPPGTSTDGTGSKSILKCTCMPGLGGSGAGETAKCQACPAGKFKRGQGIGDCLLCAAGSIAPTNGSIACELCPAGTYSASMGITACAFCAPGKYQTLPGATYCTRCGPGKYVSSANQSSDICQNCPVGKFSAALVNNLDISVCDSCRPGEYAVPGSIRCTPCPIGKHARSQDGPGGDPLYCLHCAAGKYSAALGANSSGVCAECDAGTFAERRGQTSCTACGPGTYATSGAARGQSTNICRKCAAGKYSASVGVFVETGCLECPDASSGSTTLTAGSTSILDCTGMCGPGYYPEDVSKTVCASCAAGTFKNGTNSKKCVSCRPGTYSESTGAIACSACRPGTYSASEGSTTCSECEAGKYSHGNSRNCSLCHEYATSPQGSGQDGCVCKAGFLGNGLESCVRCNSPALCPCGANFYGSNTETEGCKRCPPNSASPEGSKLIYDCQCNAGFYSIFQFDQTTYAYTLSRCDACPPASTSPEGSIGAQMISSPYTYKDSSGALNTYTGWYLNPACKCNAGYYPREEFIEETSITVGERGAGGVFWGLALKSCEACPSLSTSFPNAISVEDCVCQAGFKLGMQDGAYACKNCIDNPCECNGYWSNSSPPSSCPACPANSNSVVRLASTYVGPKSDCKCNTGYYIANANHGTIFGETYLLHGNFAYIILGDVGYYGPDGKKGVASLHFDSLENCYISFENAPNSLRLANGSPLPAQKPFINPTYDNATRTFTGKFCFSKGLCTGTFI